MSDLLVGLVPGLPDDLREQILARAEGVPLYAVETVRMLLGRGLLTREGNVYRASGDVDQLEVPETLHALVAARLDALPFEERRLVECGAVLGKTFTRLGLAEVSGMPEVKLEPLLSGLLGKEILSVQADTRSPERGQYSFLQDIVKRVAYETIAKRERKAKHLAAARYLATACSAEEDEMVEVIAAHYLDAYACAPDDDDAPELKAGAYEMLVRAAERAASLGASAAAQRAFERASELTGDELAQAELLEKAGMAAYVGGRADAAGTYYDRAIRLLESVGASHPAARVAARAAEIAWDRGRLEQGLESMDRAFSVLSEEEPDADLAALAAQIGRFRLFAGQRDLAFERIERALEIAEMLSLHETLAQALNTKGILLSSGGRTTEGLALIRNALDLALEHDKPSAALRAYYNLADVCVQVDRASESADLVREALALARKVGNRYWEWSFLGFAYPGYLLGDWDDVVAREDGLPNGDWTQVRIAFTTLLTSIVPTRVHRGEIEEARDQWRFFAELETSADVQELAQGRVAAAAFCFAEERYDEALRFALLALEIRHSMGIAAEGAREAFVLAVDAALALDDEGRAEELLAIVDALPVGHSPRYLQAHSARFHAKLAARRGNDEEADLLFGTAARQFRELAYPFCLAVTLLEHGEWLAEQGRPEASEPLLSEAGDTFDRLHARPWLERAGRLSTFETTP
jgi:tetratricopeptide (TPR) repeat protein